MPTKPKVALIHFNHGVRDGVVTWRDMREEGASPNYGDMLVCAALLRQLGPREAIRCAFGGVPRAKPEFAVVRGSTYLHGRFDFEGATRTLESLDCPVAMVGLGAQNSKPDPKFLDDAPNVRRFFDVVNERSISIGVRGKFTAEVATRLGAKNVRITGCPSLFYGRTAPTVTISPMLQHRDRRIGLSIHSKLHKSMFCRDPVAVAALHGRALLHLMHHAGNVQVFEQGSPSDFAISDHSAPFDKRREAAQALLQRIGIADFMTPDQLLCRFASVRSVEEWMGKARDFDAFVGFRFHGNMVGLAQGLPCFYFVYDSRIEEFCELYALPYQRAEDPWQDPIERMLEHDWNETNAAIKRCHEQMAAFWAENGFGDLLKTD